MITQQQIDRINELSRKSKMPEGLTEQELEEQAVLRRAYIDGMKQSLTAHLENTYVVDERGNKKKLAKKE